MRQTTPSAARAALIRSAFRLEYLTIGWMLIEAAVSLAAAAQAHSLLLAAFGLDSIVELISASVLLWRLHVELRRGADFPEAVERRAGRIAGALLFALSAYVLATACWSLWRGTGGDFSPVGFAVTLLAIPAMLLLAQRKRAIADALGSSALRADAAEATACAWLSAAVVAGLIAKGLIGAWWVEPAASLALLWFLVREGREAYEGEACCDKPS